MKKTTIRYEEEFKRRAVEMLRTSGKSRKQLARELGCSTTALSEWNQKYGSVLMEGAKRGELSADELREENRRLRQELSLVTEQREILKKATAILGQ